MHRQLVHPLVRLTSKELSRLCITAHLREESAGGFPSQRASNAENASLSWCHPGCSVNRANDMLWLRHQMETFSALLALCAGNSPVTGEFPAQRPVTRSFDIFFDLHLNKRLSKQSWGWWFETQWCLLWRHSNAVYHERCRHALTHWGRVTYQWTRPPLVQIMAYRLYVAKP